MLLRAADEWDCGKLGQEGLKTSKQKLVHLFIFSVNVSFMSERRLSTEYWVDISFGYEQLHGWGGGGGGEYWFKLLKQPGNFYSGKA